MIKNKILLGLLSVLLIGTSCKKTLDINQDPNNPSVDQGTPKLIFPAATMAVAGRVGGDLAILGGIWGEYVTQSALANQYKYIDAYNVKTNDLNAPYNGIFAGGLKNFQAVIDKAKAAEDWNFYLMGNVMKAYSAQVLVDLYDKIPYFDALQGLNNLNPKFDDGYAIYVDLLKGIDTALSKDFSARTNTVLAGTDDAGVDLVFQGNMDRWKRFANTLKLKMYLRMINAKPAEAMAGVQKLYTDNAAFLTTDAGVFGFTDGPGLDNPLYEQNIRQLNTTSNLRASRTFVSFLVDNNDPRATSYFGSANPNSIHQGDYLNVNNDPTYGTSAVFVQKPTDPVIFISAAESYFLQAEARVRYFASAGAKALYDQGVLAAFSSVGQNGSSFISTGGRYEFPAASNPFSTLSSLAEQQDSAIVVQKWASFPYGVHFIEGYFEKQRTGFPKTSTVYSTDPAYVPGQFVISKNSVLGANQLPRRLVFPEVEVTRNTNSPALVPITTPVWWAKP